MNYNEWKEYRKECGYRGCNPDDIIRRRLRKIRRNHCAYTGKTCNIHDCPYKELNYKNL